MKTEDLQNAYPNPPEDFHNAVLSSLYKLDAQSPVRYKKRRVMRVAVVCAIVAALGSFTVVAAATNFFGLFSEPVGKFGLHVGVTEEATASTSDSLKAVKMKFGYMTEGFEALPNMSSHVSKFQNINAENGECFSFSVVPAKDFDYTETYIIDSEETVVNGHKLIITTRQMTEGGEVDYGATMYFEDWGYVVGGGAYGGADKNELLKIMQNLSLEEDKDYVPETTYADMVRSDLDLKRLEYDWEVNAGFSMHKLGEAFKWGREAHSNDFTVKVTSIKEQNSTNGISEDYWNWITDYSLIHSDFFDENGKLITPYTRHDINDSDGVNTQRKEWDTEDERHFFSVTVEITQSTDSPYADFDVMGDFSPVILIKDKDGSYHHNGEEDKNGVTQRIIYGNIDTVLSTPGDEVNVLHMSKGETRTLTYGIVVDDDVLDNAYLRFNSSDDEVIDDKAETITLNYHNDCVKIKE